MLISFQWGFLPSPRGPTLATQGKSLLIAAVHNEVSPKKTVSTVFCSLQNVLPLLCKVQGTKVFKSSLMHSIINMIINTHFFWSKVTQQSNPHPQPALSGWEERMAIPIRLFVPSLYLLASLRSILGFFAGQIVTSSVHLTN